MARPSLSPAIESFSAFEKLFHYKLGKRLTVHWVGYFDWF